MADNSTAFLQELAAFLKVDALPRTPEGAVELAVGGDHPMFLFPEDAHTLMVVCPMLPLPNALDAASTLWLLRQNYYDSPLAPFRIGADPGGNLVSWGRLPVHDLTPAELAGVLEALAKRAELVRSELAPAGG